MFSLLRGIIDRNSINRRKRSFVINHHNCKSIVSFRGCDFFADPRKSNKIEAALLAGNDSYDLDNHAVVSKFVKPDAVCFDVGANIGVYAIVMGKIAGANGVVHCFEPVAHIRNKLEENSWLNQLRGIRINDFALGAEESVIEMLQVKNDQYRGGTSTFIPNENILSMGADKFESVPVKVTTLDAYVESNGISRIDFIKIDVEGFELNVLRGGKGSIAKHAPIILMEYDPVRHGKDGEKFKSFFEGEGYSVYEFSSFDRELVISPFNFEGCPNGRNILCLKLDLT